MKFSTSLLVVLALIAVASDYAYATSCGETQFNPASGYSASWIFNCEDESITVTATSQSPGWIAWGVNNNAYMPNADIAYFYVNSTGPQIADCRNNEEGSPPSPDVTIGGQNNIYNTSTSQSSTSSSMTFTRKWNTGDPIDFVISASNTGPGYVLWAYGASNNPGHGPNRNGVPMVFNLSCCYPYITSTASLTSTIGSSSSTSAVSSTSGSSTTGGGNGCTPGALFKGSASNPANTWTVTWLINCDAATFNATVTAATTGWVGMGLGVSQLMYPGDIVMSYVQNSVAYAVDRWATAHAQPQPDTNLGGTNDIFAISGTEGAGSTTVTWTRKLVTGDQYDLAILPQSMNLLWSIGSSDDITAIHENSGALVVNFFTGEVTVVKQFNSKLAHGIFMLLSFGIMFASAAFIAGYLKPLGHPWYVAHVTTNILAGVLFLIGFALIVNEKSETHNAHFVVPHERIGLLLFIAVAGQIVLGFLANALWSPERKGTPIFPDKLHWGFGGGIIILGFANVQLGFERYGYVGTALNVLQGLFYGLIAAFVLAWVIGRVWINVKKTDQHDGSAGPPKFLIGTFLIWVIIGAVLTIVIASEMYKYGNL